MEPIDQILPNRHAPPLAVVLAKKKGRVPKGEYRFTESYCTDPGDDCRAVTLVVVNEKEKPKAVIQFGFDQDGPFAGPYLDPASQQAPYAEAILALFVDSLNSNPQWLDQLYRHYRAVRKALEGKPYRGKRFPLPGQVTYGATPPPDLQAQIERSLKKLGKPVAAAPPARRPGKPAAPQAEGLQALLERYVEVGTSGPVQDLLSLQSSLRQFLLQKAGAGEEIASLLPDLFQQSPQDDERIEGALRLLYDALQIIRFDLEQDAGRAHMERLQNALALHVFQESEDLDLRTAVSNTVVQSRVEILPSLQEASGRMMIASAGRSDLHDLPGEEIISGILRSLHSLGVTSPFEGVQELLQLFLLNDAELQTALIAEMLEGEEPLLREISALMLFHDDPAVRLGASRALAAGDGGKISPQTLRRLIVSRNWFAEEPRKNIDQAITNARKARVECAPLPRPGAVAVYATPPDESGGQSFTMTVEEGEAYSSVTVLVRQGFGVVDASVAVLKGKRGLNQFLSQLKNRADCFDSSLELLDLRICHGLAEGVRSERLPSHRLLQCAELLGRDGWRPIAFDPARELLQMREDLEAMPERGMEPDLCAAAEESANWRDHYSFLSGWMEAGNLVAAELQAWQQSGHELSADIAVDQVADAVMERRRSDWLERLVWTALWLKGAKTPPLPWQKMYHLAQAVADETLPLKEIPLMRAVAAASVAGYLAREQGSTTRKREN